MVRIRSSINARAGGQRGFTYLGLLLAIAILGIGLTAASEVLVTTTRHQRLQQLEWTGAQFTQALGSYYVASPGAVKTYPNSLEELLEDRRYVTVRRHLRTVYMNPFTGRADWEHVVAADGRIRGVRVRIPTGAGVEVREFLHIPSGS